MKSMGIGIIGCGFRARMIALQVIEKCPQVSVLALCDPSERSLDLAKKELNPQAKVYATPEELAADPRVDWVMVGSINSLHGDHAVAALEAGKHVFCEKPLDTTLEDCQRIEKAHKDSGKMFYVGFTLRHAPIYRKIKQILDSGTLGYLVSFEFNETLDFNHGGHVHRNWRRHSRNTGSHLLEKCCHDIDLANWMVGDLARYVASFGGVNFFLPKNAHRVEEIGPHANGAAAYMYWNWKTDSTTHPFLGQDKDVVDNQVAILEYANGVRATFHTNCNAAIPERRMCLLGSEGTLRADLNTDQIELRRIGWDSETQHFSMNTDSEVIHGGGDQVLVDELLASMFHQTPPPAGLREGMISAITCFAIEEARRRREIVDLVSWWEEVGMNAEQLCAANPSGM